MNIVIPERLNRNAMYLLLSQVVTETGNPLHDEYVFQMEACRKFIEPIGVTFLNNFNINGQSFFSSRRQSLTNWFEDSSILHLFLLICLDFSTFLL
jgi:hypothetical protein